MPSDPSVSVIIPVFRGESTLPRLLMSIRAQRPPCDEVLVVETESTPEVAELARSAGAEYISIDRCAFDHAGTRSMAARRTTTDVLVFLTQDVILRDETTLRRLVASLWNDDEVGAAYGRQVPDENADPVAAVKRLFNYPDQSHTKRKADRDRLGLRTPFLSNAFAAYRRRALEEISFFGNRELICEDVRAGAALLEAGWAIHYEADAVVHHTHHFGLGEEFGRYFDIGVAHRKQQWILDRFGGTDREGFRYLGMGVRHLRTIGRAHNVSGFVLRSALGRVAYSVGRHHRRLPRALCRRLSSFPLWWDRPDAT
jgi:rhamnosyltransferase